MLKRIGVLVAAGALCLMWVLADSAQAQCVVDTSTPTYANGQFLRYNPCDAHGNVKVTGGGGGSGDASLAEQQTQTGLLTTIDADTGTIAGAVKAEDAAHSSGHTGIPFWGVRNDSAATSLADTNGDYTPIATDSNGRLFINTISSIFSVTPGTTATALGKAEDAAHTSGDTGVMALCVRQDTAAALAGTNGDYIPCTTDATGRMWTNTELPDAAALADGTSNPTTTGVAAYNMCFNGTTWDRCTGISTTATNTGTIAGAVDTTGTDRVRVTMYDSSGNEIVVPTAGLTSYTAAGASTNATSVKGSAGTVYHYTLTNTTTTIYYLRMYNLSSAPTCSSSTGYVATIPIPPAAAAGGAGGREIPQNIGQAFTTGIGFCVTGGASSTDNTSAATGVFVEILYK